MSENGRGADESQEERGEDSTPTEDDGLSSGISGTEAPPISPGWRRLRTIIALVFIAAIVAFLVVFIIYGSADDGGAGGGILGLLDEVR